MRDSFYIFGNTFSSVYRSAEASSSNESSNESSDLTGDEILDLWKTLADPPPPPPPPPPPLLPPPPPPPIITLSMQISTDQPGYVVSILTSGSAANELWRVTKDILEIVEREEIKHTKLDDNKFRIWGQKMGITAADVFRKIIINNYSTNGDPDIIRQTNEAGDVEFKVWTVHFSWPEKYLDSI